MQRAVAFAVSILAVLSSCALAQEQRSELSFQGTGYFTSSVSGNGISYSATNSAGFLSTYRYQLNHRVSVEAAYGFSDNTQSYVLSNESFQIQSEIHQFTAAFVVSLRSRAHSKVNPYFLLGGGGVHFVPSSTEFNSLSGAQGQTKGAFVYGLGLDYAIHHGIFLRAEYRGLLYAPPDFGFGALTTNAVTQAAIPSVGVGFKF